MASEPRDLRRSGQLVPDGGTARRPGRPKRKMFDAGFFVVSGIAVSAALFVWHRDGSSRVLEILTSGTGLIISIGPKILAAILLAAWLRLLLPREKISRYLGGRQGFRGMSIAVLLGIVLPGGPMTVFPLAIAFFQAGAGFGIIVTFLTSWLLLGANRTIVWEMAFVEYWLVGLRYALCLPLPFLFGWIAQLLERTHPDLLKRVTW